MTDDEPSMRRAVTKTSVVLSLVGIENLFDLSRDYLP